jgi:hypothetical protein
MRVRTERQRQRRKEANTRGKEANRGMKAKSSVRHRWRVCWRDPRAPE